MSRSAGGVFPPGRSPLETVMVIPPVQSSVFCFLNTADYLCVRNTSRTLRNFMDHNKRFFRNLVFLRRGGELWLDLLEAEFNNASLLCITEAIAQIQLEDFLQSYHKRMWSQKQRDGISLNLILQCGRANAPEILEYWEPMANQVINELANTPHVYMRRSHTEMASNYYPMFMGRHLAQILKNLPIGKNLASIVLDGTGVDTEWMQHLLCSYSSTLRGVSTRFCPNIDAWVFADWLLDSIRRHHVVSLRWLRVWGCGNIPDFFNASQLLEGIQPLTPHPDDEYAGRPLDIRSMRKAYANILPKTFHFEYTRLLLAPMFLHGQERQNHLARLANVMGDEMETIGSYDDLHESTPDPFIEWEPSDVPLGDINPIIALLGVARYLKITLDFALCASMHFCWSFILAERVPMPLQFQIVNQGMLQILLANNTVFQVPMLNNRTERMLHTHSLAEVGARKAAGGQVCYICGLWENSPAPNVPGEQQLDTNDIGGYVTGSGIGEGRMSIGSLCVDCQEFMTCGVCGKFICQNCMFGDPGGPANPFSIGLPDLEHVRMVCTQPGHSPECIDCVASRSDLYFQCGECGGGTCLRCYPPNGRRIRTNLFGGTLDMTEQDNTQEGMHIPYSKTWPVASHRIGRLKAFQAEVAQNADDILRLVVVEESYIFEYCDGCNAASCTTCMAKHAETVSNPGEFFARPSASLWTVCGAGCRRVFCEGCIENPAIILKCQTCDRWECNKCIKHRIYFGVPDGMDGTWCDGPKCCQGPTFQGKLLDLVGPWEEKEMVPGGEGVVTRVTVV